MCGCSLIVRRKVPTRLPSKLRFQNPCNRTDGPDSKEIDAKIEPIHRFPQGTRFRSRPALRSIPSAPPKIHLG
ncbi:hypothetical protein RRSWK_04433 [Rhodopirellula sp. SWK7]|nr:hypothetical protein RRSWK_04433 [Rhodopirellula sp. SWK7]